ncbi:hypothetical protein Tco_0203211, partial [Tanacetum coccineum]
MKASTEVAGYYKGCNRGCRLLRRLPQGLQAVAKAATEVTGYYEGWNKGCREGCNKVCKLMRRLQQRLLAVAKATAKAATEVVGCYEGCNRGYGFRPLWLEEDLVIRGKGGELSGVSKDVGIAVEFD